ncbi:adenylosuccinate synthase [Haloferula rosea]|uniref:Adenylosuccinate synthetase n=1 Tax=Haloferula rosea TaxID=490093 RepID=A0A934RBG8_9BACT|nr:adenylosuccinate synthase [Haloferula rosea]MBK1825405.1 adenylosuccinate synthase [Haloferula rosea]
MNTIVTGLQWGDEGKGKIVDYLTETADVVVRGQGGNNAGHTVIAKGTKYVLHLLPSGILWDDKINVIGNGVVLDPVGLVAEIEKVEAQGVKIPAEKLLISDRAHVVLPLHKELDAAREAALGDRRIGTTKRGIGPTYADKVNRNGLRVADLLDEEFFRETVARRTEEANEILAKFDLPTFDAKQQADEVLAAFERLKPHVTNTIPVLHEAWKSDKEILFEGAQGTLLDIDFGTFPFVTSSNTTAGGCCTGSGLPPTAIDQVIGVCKAYTTRVGSGPFPSVDEALSQFLHDLGREFGATTGRPRGCGWLDVVLLRQGCMVNGTTGLAVTNVDGLDDYETLRICVAYDIDGVRHELAPADRRAWERAQPIYEELPGWQTDTTGCTSYADLPEKAKAYLQRLSELCDTPIQFVGVGPDRDQTLVV